jgi:uncharacterized protein (DUF2336 family)
MLGDLLELAREPSSEKRSALLRRITDLFFDGMSERNVSECALFEEVVLRVMRDVDGEGRAALASSIADRRGLPRRLIMALACDDIAVARPILERSPSLEDADLIAVSHKASDAHLQAISRRTTLSEMVTDVLLARGSLVVMQLLAANSGARFSMVGFGRLVEGSRADETLQYDLATRQDLPRSVVEALAAILSEKLRQTLRSLGVNSPDALAPALLDTLQARLSHAMREKERETREISTIVREIRDGASSLDREVVPLARGDRAYDIASVVADLASIDHATAMKALTGPAEEPLIVLFRSLEASWETFEAVLQLRAKRQRRNYVRSLALARTYQEMDKATAQRVLRFLQIRRQSEVRAA